MKKIIVLIILICAFVEQGYSQLFKFTFDGQASSPGQGNIVSVQNATVTAVTRSGSPLAYAATDEVYNTSGWNLSSQGSQYLYVTITADPGYKVSIQSFGFGAWSTYTGPSNGSASIEKSGSSVYSNTFTPGKAATSGASAPSSLPPFPFDLSSSIITSDINGSLTIKIFGWGNASGGNLRIDNFYVNGTVQPNSPLSIDYTNGKVGISTTTPAEKLDVNGNVKTTGLIIPTSAGVGKILTSDANGVASWQPASITATNIWGSIGNTGTTSSNFLGTSDAQPLIIKTNNTERLRIDENGNIKASGKLLIGTIDIATVTDYALAVNGTAIFTKAKVKANASWPDYVFEDNYHLLPLSSLEQYIAAHKHLPQIPSASEIQKEGIDIGNTQTTLVQKIEELTLYAIDQNKKVEELTKQIDELKKLITEKKSTN